MFQSTKSKSKAKPAFPKRPFKEADVDKNQDDFSGNEDPTSKASPPERDLMNFAAAENKENLFIFSESDEECQGKRIRTFSFDPENYEPGPGQLEAGTGHIPQAPSRRKKPKSNQLPPNFLNTVALHLKDEEPVIQKSERKQI